MQFKAIIPYLCKLDRDLLFQSRHGEKFPVISKINVLFKN